MGDVLTLPYSFHELRIKSNEIVKADNINSVFALAFLNALSGSEKMSSPLNMLNIAVNVRNAFVGNFNQKPYYYHPDTWKDGGGDFIFIPKRNLKK